MDTWRARSLSWRDAASAALLRLCRDPGIAPRCGRAELDIPLRRAPMLRHALSVLLAALLAHGGHLAWAEQWLAAFLLLLLSGVGIWRLRAMDPPARDAPVRLLMSADGRIHLLTAGASLQPAILDPSSMRLGPWLLLVLNGPAGTCRLVLGPGNVEAGALACLRRRLCALSDLAAAPGAHRSGVDCVRGGLV